MLGVLDKGAEQPIVECNKGQPTKGQPMNYTWRWELWVNGRDTQIIRSEGTWTTIEEAMKAGREDCAWNCRKGQERYLCAVQVDPIGQVA